MSVGELLQLSLPAGGEAGSRVRAFQSRRLRRLVHHAQQSVPWYADHFRRAGLAPSEVRGISDLASIPVARRRDLQAATDGELLSRSVDPERLVLRRTSGSSGAPLTIRRTRGEERLLILLQLRALAELGVRPRDRIATVARADSSGSAAARDPLFGGLARLGLYRQTRVSCLESPEAIARRLAELDPHVVTGFPGTLARVADVLADAPANVRVSARVVIPVGEVVAPGMRSRIAEGFRAPVLELYAAHEFHAIGWQCRHSGLYHTCDRAVLVEVVREGRSAAPGESGMLVGTALHSFAMPFLRYELGDVVTRGPERCPCGHPSGTLSAIAGRRIDYFVLPGGRLVHPYEIGLAFVRPDAPRLRQYQLTQEREDRFELRVVPLGRAVPDALSRLAAELREAVGEGVDVRVRVVEEIEPEPNGKFRPFRSLIASDYETDAS